MNMYTLKEAMSRTSYPGRGIMVGRSEDGAYAVCAYFIMGRSTNSRNRVFVPYKGGIRTQAFDPALLEDPSLIIYTPVRVLGSRLIVTNGDQTDTVFEGMTKGLTFEESLRCREYEPDGPNYTPRISALINPDSNDFSYDLSILKSDQKEVPSCRRYTFSYEAPKAGTGHFIHTYMGDGQPLPSFEGEPEEVKITGDIDEVTNTIWQSLNEDNRVSLFVRFISLENGETCTRIVNKNQKAK